MVASVTANTLAQTATTLKEQFMAKTIDLATYKSSVTSQVASQVTGNETFKQIQNADAIDTVYAVISHAKTATAETLETRRSK
jgi:hypothetical protein